MLTIILYVLTIILYTDSKCLLYQKIYIDKNGNTIYIKSDYWKNMLSYCKLLTASFALHSIPLGSILLAFGSDQFNSH